MVTVMEGETDMEVEERKMFFSGRHGSFCSRNQALDFFIQAFFLGDVKKFQVTSYN